METITLDISEEEMVALVKVAHSYKKSLIQHLNDSFKTMGITNPNTKISSVVTLETDNGEKVLPLPKWMLLDHQITGGEEIILDVVDDKIFMILPPRDFDTPTTELTSQQ